jgi:hypothetical protein
VCMSCEKGINDNIVCHVCMWNAKYICMEYMSWVL